MTPPSSFQSSNQPSLPTPPSDSGEGLQRVINHLTQSLQREVLVQQTVNQLRESLHVDRVVLYYFYRQWKGQVTFESLSDEHYSILGSTGADECFNDEYAALYLAGRVRSIANVAQEPINECHRDFLLQIDVRANLAVPILTNKGLWGLLIAHDCHAPHVWSEEDVRWMQWGAETLAADPAIQAS